MPSPRESPSGNATKEAVEVLPVVTLIFGGLLQLLAEVHALQQFRMIFVFGGLILLLLALGFSRVSEQGFGSDHKRFLRQIFIHGALPFLLALVLWSGVTYLRSEFRTVAVAELLRILSGVCAFLIGGFLLRANRRSSVYVIAGIIVLACAFCLLDFSEAGRTGSIVEGLHTGFFATHEELGTLLMLPLPVAAAFALVPEASERRRVFGFASLLLLLIGLLFSQCRSAWLGAIASGVTLVFVLTLSAPCRRRSGVKKARQVNLAVPTFIGLSLAMGIGIVVASTGSSTALIRRVVSLNRLSSSSTHGTILGDRLRKWQGAALMAMERPLTGWGLGAFQVQQARWTHQGTEVQEVLLGGSGHENIAHNYYAQWGADTGGIGLLIYIGFFTTVVSHAFQVLRLQKQNGVALSPESRALLAGLLAAVIGGALDALGSPSYNFAGLSTLYWMLAGLCVGEANEADGYLRAPSDSRRGAQGVPAHKPFATPLLTGFLTGLMGAAIFLALGYLIKREGTQSPRGVLRLSVSPRAYEATTARAKDVTWIAIFTDGTGKKQSTAPGAVWLVEAAPLTLTTAPVRLHRLKGVTANHLPAFPVAPLPDQAALQMRLHPGEAVRVTVTYRDFWGRRYTASSVSPARSGIKELK